MAINGPAILLIVTLDRKTGEVLNFNSETSNERIDYSGLVDEYANKIMAEMKWNIGN